MSWQRDRRRSLQLSCGSRSHERRALAPGAHPHRVLLQSGLWAVSSVSPDPNMQQLGYLLSDAFLAAVSVLAAAGFLLYGGRLIFMLQRFPIESRGRRKKLWEVGLVTSICAGCFSFR